MDQQLAELTKAILAQGESLKKFQVHSEAIQASVEEIKTAVLELQKWKPKMEQSVDGLQSKVGELRSQVVQISHNPILAIRPVDLPLILPSSDIKLESASVVDSVS